MCDHRHKFQCVFFFNYFSGLVLGLEKRGNSSRLFRFPRNPHQTERFETMVEESFRPTRNRQSRFRFLRHAIQHRTRACKTTKKNTPKNRFTNKFFLISIQQVYLYIKNKTIAGCLVAEQRSEAHKRIEENGLDLCTEETYPIKCGVSRIWVSRNCRRAGIGTILMDCLKANFVYGCVLSNDDVAFSSPTEMGNSFAKKYFKTSNYLIYM